VIKLPPIHPGLHATFPSPQSSLPEAFAAGRGHLAELREPDSFSIKNTAGRGGPAENRYDVSIMFNRSKMLNGLGGPSLHLELMQNRLRIEHRFAGQCVVISTKGEVRPALRWKRPDAVAIAHTAAEWLYDLASTALSSALDSSSPEWRSVQQDINDVAAFVNTIRVPNHLPMVHFANAFEPGHISGLMTPGPEADLARRFLEKCVPPCVTVSPQGLNRHEVFITDQNLRSSYELDAIRRMELIADWTARLDTLEESQ